MDAEHDDTNGNFNTIQAKTTLQLSMSASRTLLGAFTLIGVPVAIWGGATHGGPLVCFSVGLTLIVLAGNMLVAYLAVRGDLTLFRLQQGQHEDLRQRSPNQEVTRRMDDLARRIEDLARGVEAVHAEGLAQAQILTGIAKVAEDQLALKRHQR